MTAHGGTNPNASCSRLVSRMVISSALAPARLSLLRPSLTAAVRSACENSGRGGETALSRTEKHQISPATGCRYPHQTARRRNCTLAPAHQTQWVRRAIGLASGGAAPLATMLAPIG